ncbi:hypothetical protein B566_EDAN018149 [Ephemera danica]|nr:hypothetical protein B566_EDAN018149 [Ephemera danica]
MNVGKTAVGSRYFCHLCGKSYGLKGNLTMHITTAHATRDLRVSCAICNKIYSNKRSLNDHMRFTHSGKVQCPLCFKVLASRMGFGVGIASAEGSDGRYYCHMCSRSYKYKDDLTKHINTLHSAVDLRVACAICDKICKNRKSLLNHLRFNHSGNQQCQHCHQQFSSKQALKNHMQLHCLATYETALSTVLRLGVSMAGATGASAVRFCCQQCGNSYKHRGNLLKHVKFNHSKLDLSVACKICKKVCPNSKSLLNHMSYSHYTTQNKVKCMYCSKYFSTQNFLNIHLKRIVKLNISLTMLRQYKNDRSEVIMIHQPQCLYIEFPRRIGVRLASVESANEDRFFCHLCNNSYKHKGNLQKHINLNHTNVDLRVACKVCQKICHNSKSLLDHMRYKHRDNSRNLKCDYCSSFFTTQKFLQRHMKQRCHLLRTQSAEGGSERYYCHLCRMFWSEKFDLTEHILANHTAQDSSLSCLVCHAKYRDHQSLFNHMKNAHRKQVECPHCKKSFVDKKYLYLHTRGSYCAALRSHGLSLAHGSSVGLRFQCPMCSKSYRYRSDLRKHITLGHATHDLTVECEVCKKKCSNRRSLTDHMRNNHKNKPHCPYCHMVLSSKAAIERHVRGCRFAVPHL